MEKQKSKREKLAEIREGLMDLILDHGTEMLDEEILAIAVIDNWLNDMDVPNRKELH